MAFTEDLTGARLHGSGRVQRNTNVELVTAPIVYPVTLQETKDHLRIDTAEQDTMLTNLIGTATRVLERAYAMSFLVSSYRQAQNYADARLKILRYPLNAVSAVKYIASMDADTEVVVGTSLYTVQTKLGEIAARSVWPTHRYYQSFIVYFTAGYGDAGTDAGDTNAIAAARALVPPDIKEAVMDLAGHLYENPEGQGAEVKYESQLKSYGDLPLMIQRLMGGYQWRTGAF